MTFSLSALAIPIVQAPMAGGPSTVGLAAATNAAGGLGFLAAGGLSAAALRADINALATQTDRPFGVNLFADPGGPGDPGAVAAYAARLRAEHAELGQPRHHNDALEAKLAVVRELQPAVVSFTFGCPPPEQLAPLREAGIAIWLTVTTPDEVAAATRAGADALVVQGVEAGGHRGSWDDGLSGEIGLLTLLELAKAETPLPLIAAGGLATGPAIAAVLAMGADAAQLGTALMRTDEAGTSVPHRAALAAGGVPTGLTRAFTGRVARGIVNTFQAKHAGAPSGYPEIHELTLPMRAAARASGNPELLHLWAGQAYELAQEGPAATVIADLWASASAASGQST